MTRSCPRPIPKRRAPEGYLPARQPGCRSDRRRGPAPATLKTCAPRSLVVLHMVPFSSHSDRPAGRNRPKTGPICAPQPQVAHLAWRAQRRLAHFALAAQPMYSPHFSPQCPPLICPRSRVSTTRRPLTICRTPSHEASPSANPLRPRLRRSKGFRLRPDVHVPMYIGTSPDKSEDRSKDWSAIRPS